jgi:tRNA nucleotidyltransferase/poly(A) polymerase
MVTVQEAISLTQEEQELFTLLLESVKHAGTDTTLRCAGGWVRDKLLGKESKDIDVALDNMLGKDFADKARRMVFVVTWTHCSSERQTCVIIHAFLHVYEALVQSCGWWPV